jgi:hypothetical protein
MSFAFVQQVETSIASGAGQTLVAPSLTVTGGNLLVIATTGPSTTLNTTTLSDGAVGNTYIRIVSLNDAADNRCINYFYALNAKSGATVVTTTTTGGWQDGIYVAEYSGASVFLASNSNLNASPGLGTDAVTSGLINVTSAPALLVGYAHNTSGPNTASAGTGFTGRTTVWVTVNARGFPQDMTENSTGNVAATWTAANGSNTELAIIAAFAGASANAPVVSSLSSMNLGPG